MKNAFLMMFIVMISAALVTLLMQDYGTMFLACCFAALFITCYWADGAWISKTDRPDK